MKRSELLHPQKAYLPSFSVRNQISTPSCAYLHVHIHRLCTSTFESHVVNHMVHAGGRTPPLRSPSQLTSIPYGGRTPDHDPNLIPLQEPVLERDHEDTLKLLLGGVVDRRMSIINIQYGATPADSVGMPVAAWVLGECLLHWALRWRPAEVILGSHFSEQPSTVQHFQCQKGHTC